MVANLIDAHRAAGHRIRRFLWEVRLSWIHRRFSKKARRYASVEDWFGAYKYVEWMYVGRRDHADVFSRVAAAVAAERAERPDLADERWREAGEMEPHLDVWREAVEGWFGLRESQNKS